MVVEEGTGCWPRAACATLDTKWQFSIWQMSFAADGLQIQQLCKITNSHNSNGMRWSGERERERGRRGRESETGSPSWLTKWKFIGAAHRSRRPCGDAAAAQGERVLEREGRRERKEREGRQERGKCVRKLACCSDAAPLNYFACVNLAEIVCNMIC